MLSRNQVLGLAGAAAFGVALVLFVLGGDELSADRRQWVDGLVIAGLFLVALGHFWPARIHR